MIIIKLNPSQELRLRKSVQCNAEFANAKGSECESVPQPQGLEGGSVFATPLLCPIVNLSREEFLSIKKFTIYKMQNAGGIYFFPCIIELPQRVERVAFLCGVSGGYFSLQDFLNKAGGIIATAPKNFWSEDFFFFSATSFKMCDMEINRNSWKVYDEVWKKI